MSKFIRKSKINKFSEADFDTREYIDLPEQTEEEDEDEELLSIEAEISRLNAKRAARQKMLSQRTGGEKQKYNEEYFMQALKPNKYNQSSIKSMRDLSADNQTIIRESAINRDEYAVDNGDNYRSYFKEYYENDNHICSCIIINSIFSFCSADGFDGSHASFDRDIGFVDHGLGRILSLHP